VELDLQEHLVLLDHPGNRDQQAPLALLDLLVHRVPVDQPDHLE